MKILAVDTSSKICAVAILEDNNVIDEIKLDNGNYRLDVHIADVIRPRKVCDWEIKTLKYSRASEANGFMASLSECFRKIVDIELRSESPYESMKRAYPEEWHRAMHRQFIINLTPDGIRFNDYFGI